MKKVALIFLVCLLIINGITYARQEKDNLAFRIKIGDIEKSKELIKQGVGLNEPEIEGHYPLTLAIKNGYNELAKMMIETNKISYEKIKPIFSALGVENNTYWTGYNEYNLEMIKYLVEHKVAFLNESFMYIKCSPLIFAVKTKNIDIVKLFIENSANINYRNEFGDTALSFAIKNDLYDITKYLIENGADLKNKNREGLTYLMLSENEEISRLLLLNGAEIDFKGYSILLEPKCLAKTMVLAEYMIKMGFDINEKDNDGKTALSYVTRIENTRYLIQMGSKINIKDNMGRTPLINQLCTYQTESNFEILKLLIENGAELNVRDQNSKTVLDYSIEYRNEEITKILIEKGIELNNQDKFGKTALMKAIETYQFEIAKLLIVKGAKKDLKDVDNKTASNYAIEVNENELIELLGE